MANHGHDGKITSSRHRLNERHPLVNIDRNGCEPFENRLTLLLLLEPGSEGPNPVATPFVEREQSPVGKSPSLAYVPALDGIRGIAIAAVMVAHAAPESLLFVAKWGALGVDLFFVLSGYLITNILLNTAGKPGYFRNFYARRFLRLFPVYYGWLFVLAFLFPALHRLVNTSMPDYSGNWWWYLGYLSNWKPNGGAGDPYLGHFWSLAVEEQFYLLWPTVVLLAGRTRLAWVGFAMLTASLVLRLAWYSPETSLEVYRNTFTRLDEMAAGALASLFVPALSRQFPYRRWATAGAFLCAAVCLVAIGNDWFTRTVGQTLLALSFAVLIVGAALSKSAILSAAPLRALGKYSYCIYVIHIAVFGHIGWVAAWAGAPYAVSTAAKVAVTIALAMLSWRWFEEPLLKLKRHFA